MAVIMDYYFNNTRVIVEDDCFCSKEEVEGILKRIGEIATRALSSNNEQKEETA